MSPLIEHIMLIPIDQSLIFVLYDACLAEKPKNTNFIVIGLILSKLEHISTLLYSRTITTTPPMRFYMTSDLL